MLQVHEVPPAVADVVDVDSVHLKLQRLEPRLVPEVAVVLVETGVTDDAVELVQAVSSIIAAAEQGAREVDGAALKPAGVEPVVAVRDPLPQVVGFSRVGGA